MCILSSRGRMPSSHVRVPLLCDARCVVGVLQCGLCPAVLNTASPVSASPLPPPSAHLPTTTFWDWNGHPRAPAPVLCSFFVGFGLVWAGIYNPPPHTHTHTRSYTLVGLEQTAESVRLPDYVWPERVVLVLGREKEGIPPEVGTGD